MKVSAARQRSYRARTWASPGSSPSRMPSVSTSTSAATSRRPRLRPWPGNRMHAVRGIAHERETRRDHPRSVVEVQRPGRARAHQPDLAEDVAHPFLHCAAEARHRAAPARPPRPSRPRSTPVPSGGCLPRHRAAAAAQTARRGRRFPTRRCRATSRARARQCIARWPYCQRAGVKPASSRVGEARPSAPTSSRPVRVRPSASTTVTPVIAALTCRDPGFGQERDRALLGGSGIHGDAQIAVGEHPPQRAVVRSRLEIDPARLHPVGHSDLGNGAAQWLQRFGSGQGGCRGSSSRSRLPMRARQTRPPSAPQGRSYRPPRW